MTSSEAHHLMCYSPRRDIRRAVFESRYRNQVTERGLEVLAQLLEERSCLAEMMGQSSYAEYALSSWVSERPGAVEDFLGEVARGKAGEGGAAREGLEGGFLFLSLFCSFFSVFF